MRNLIIILLVAIWGCNEIEQCQLEPNNNFFVGAFYNKSDSTGIDTLVFNSISNGINTSSGPDSVFFGVGLPLNPSDSVLSYTFDTDSTEYSLSLSYKTIYYLFSPDCDPSIRFYDLKVTDTNFDSVAVIGDILDTQIPINVEIYL